VKPFLIFTMMAVLFPTSYVWALKGEEPFPVKGTVAYENGLVTVKERYQAVMPVLKQVSEQAGIHIFLFEPLRENRVPCEINREPLDRFLGTMLKGHNYAVLYPAGYASSQGGKGSSGMPAEFAPQDEQKGLKSRADKDDRMDHGAHENPSLERKEGLIRNPDAGMASDPAEDPGFSTARAAAITEPAGSVMQIQASTPGVSACGFSMASSGEAVSSRDAVYNATTTGSSVSGGDTTAAGTSSPSASSMAAASTTGVYQETEWTRKDHIQLMISNLEDRIASGQSDRDYEKWSSIKGEKYVIHDTELLAYYKQRLASLP
jgi:hypothetical protein